MSSKMQAKFTYRPIAVDLFCGAGGMSEGIIQAGFDIAFSSDINAQVEVTYKNRHKQLGLVQGVDTFYFRGDIKDLEGAFILDKIKSLPKYQGIENLCIDAVFGGPPCQGFSRNGERKGPDDPRNFLFKEYVRVIGQLQPNYVVMENVEGFTDTILEGFVGLNGTSYHGKDALAPNLLMKELNLIGYEVVTPTKILDASDYGVPQARHRAIFIAYKKGLWAPEYPEPRFRPEQKITVMEAIADLCSMEKNRKSSKYIKESKQGRTPSFITGKPIKAKDTSNTDLSKFTKVVTERFSLFEEGESTAMLRKRIKKEGIDLTGKNALLDLCISSLPFVSRETVIDHFLNEELSDEDINVLLTKKNVRTRLDSTAPSPTVVTIADDFIHPVEPRTFSVRELARLQSFDDSFEFLGKRTTGGPRRRVEVPQYTQVGNAVPPLLAKAIALEILKAIEKNKSN